MNPGDSSSLITYVMQTAPGYRLDPYAVLSVAYVEGMSGKIGDNGTSFGPWQLHQGGAYPAGAPSEPAAANAWAWSPAGINYALGRMSSVAGGLKGPAAVHAIVYGFERPANPAAEYQAALAKYPKGGGGSSFWSHLEQGFSQGATDALGGLNPALGAITGAAGGVGGIVSGASSVGTVLGDLTSASFWIRALEVIGGGILLLLGLYLLARQVGLAPSPAQAAMLTPAGRAAAMGEAASAELGVGAAA